MGRHEKESFGQVSGKQGGEMSMEKLAPGLLKLTFKISIHEFKIKQKQTPAEREILTAPNYC